MACLFEIEAETLQNDDSHMTNQRMALFVY